MQVVDGLDVCLTVRYLSSYYISLAARLPVVFQGKTCIRTVFPVSLSKAAIPISRLIPYLRKFLSKCVVVQRMDGSKKIKQASIYVENNGDSPRPSIIATI